MSAIALAQLLASSKLPSPPLTSRTPGGTLAASQSRGAVSAVRHPSAASGHFSSPARSQPWESGTIASRRRSRWQRAMSAAYAPSRSSPSKGRVSVAPVASAWHTARRLRHTPSRIKPSPPAPAAARCERCSRRGSVSRSKCPAICEWRRQLWWVGGWGLARAPWCHALGCAQQHVRGCPEHRAPWRLPRPSETATRPRLAVRQPAQARGASAAQSGQ